MSDREALAAALEIYDLRFEAQTFGEWSHAIPTLVAAALERLAQLPEKCPDDRHVGYDEYVVCPTCHGSGKVYPAELVERIARALHDAQEKHRAHPSYWEEQLPPYKAMMTERAVAVLDALNDQVGEPE